MKFFVYPVLICFFILEQIAQAQLADHVNTQAFREVVVPEAVDFRTVEMTANLRFSEFSVSVKNRERASWSGVKVIFRFPSGLEFVGKGVAEIEPGRQSSYIMDEGQLEEARGELLGAESNFEVPKVIVSHLVRSSSQD